MKMNSNGKKPGGNSIYASNTAERAKSRQMRAGSAVKKSPATSSKKMSISKDPTDRLNSMSRKSSAQSHQQSIQSSSNALRGAQVSSSKVSSVRREFIDSKNPYLWPQTMERFERRQSQNTSGYDSIASDVPKLNIMVGGSAVQPYDDKLSKGTGAIKVMSAQRSQVTEPFIADQYDNETFGPSHRSSYLRQSVKTAHMPNADSPGHHPAGVEASQMQQRPSIDQRFTFGDLHNRQSEVSSQVAGLTSPSPHDLVSLGQTGKKASGGGNNYDMLVTSALKLEDLSSSLVKSNVTTNEQKARPAAGRSPQTLQSRSVRTNSLFRNRDKSAAMPSKLMTVQSLGRATMNIVGSDGAQDDSESLMSKTREVMMKGSVHSNQPARRTQEIDSNTSQGFKKHDEEDIEDLELANCQELLNDNSLDQWRSSSNRMPESDELAPGLRKRQSSEVVDSNNPVYQRRMDTNEDKQEFIDTGKLKFIKQVSRKSDVDTQQSHVRNDDGPEIMLDDIAKAEFEICESAASSPTKIKLKSSGRMPISRTNEKKATGPSLASKKEPQVRTQQSQLSQYGHHEQSNMKIVFKPSALDRVTLTDTINDPNDELKFGRPTSSIHAAESNQMSDCNVETTLANMPIVTSDQRMTESTGHQGARRETEQAKVSPGIRRKSRQPLQASGGSTNKRRNAAAMGTRSNSLKKAANNELNSTIGVKARGGVSLRKSARQSNAPPEQSYRPADPIGGSSNYFKKLQNDYNNSFGVRKTSQTSSNQQQAKTGQGMTPNARSNHQKSTGIEQIASQHHFQSVSVFRSQLPSSTIKVSSSRDDRRPDFRGPVKVVHEDHYELFQLRQCDDLLTTVEPTVMLSSERDSARPIDVTSLDVAHHAPVQGKPPMSTQSVTNVSRLTSLAVGTPGQDSRGGQKRIAGRPQSSAGRGSRPGSRQQSAVQLEDKQKNQYFRKKIEQQYKVERSRSREEVNSRGLRAGSSRREMNNSSAAADSQRPSSKHRFTPNSSQRMGPHIERRVNGFNTQAVNTVATTTLELLKKQEPDRADSGSLRRIRYDRNSMQGADAVNKHSRLLGSDLSDKVMTSFNREHSSQIYSNESQQNHASFQSGPNESLKMDYMNIQQHPHERSETKSGAQSSPEARRLPHGHASSQNVAAKEDFRDGQNGITVFSPKILSEKNSIQENNNIKEILYDIRTNQGLQSSSRQSGTGTQVLSHETDRLQYPRSSNEIAPTTESRGRNDLEPAFSQCSVSGARTGPRKSLKQPTRFDSKKSSSQLGHSKDSNSKAGRQRRGASPASVAKFSQSGSSIYSRKQRGGGIKMIDPTSPKNNKASDSIFKQASSQRKQTTSKIRQSDKRQRGQSDILKTSKKSLVVKEPAYNSHTGIDNFVFIKGDSLKKSRASSKSKNKKQSSEQKIQSSFNKAEASDHSSHIIRMEDLLQQANSVDQSHDHSINKHISRQRVREEDEITTSSIALESKRSNMSDRFDHIDVDNTTPLISLRKQGVRDFEKVSMLPSKIGLLEQDVGSPIKNQKVLIDDAAALRSASKYEAPKKLETSMPIDLGTIDKTLPRRDSDDDLSEIQNEQSQLSVRDEEQQHVDLTLNDLQPQPPNSTKNATNQHQNQQPMMFNQTYAGVVSDSQRAKVMGNTTSSNTQQMDFAPFLQNLQMNSNQTEPKDADEYSQPSQTQEEDPQYLADLSLFISTSKEQQEKELVKIEKRLAEVAQSIERIMVQLSEQSQPNQADMLQGSTGAPPQSSLNGRRYVQNLMNLMQHLTEQQAFLINRQSKVQEDIQKLAAHQEEQRKKAVEKAAEEERFRQFYLKKLAKQQAQKDGLLSDHSRQISMKQGEDEDILDQEESLQVDQKASVLSRANRSIPESDAETIQMRDSYGKQQNRLNYMHFARKAGARDSSHTHQ